MTKYLAFDIEIARDFNRIPLAEFEPNEWETVEVRHKDEWVKVNYEGKYGRFLDAIGGVIDADHWRPVGGSPAEWKRFRPLGITCAAAYSSDGRLWNWWANEGGEFRPQMSETQCWYLLWQLRRLVDEEGYTLLTWNGLGFDLDILAEEAYDDAAVAARLALTHIDMMYHFFCSKGYPLGLDAAAKGLRLPGKPEGMSGALAPELWRRGEYHRVLEYVSWDAENTLMVAEDVDRIPHISWTSQSGRPMIWNRGERWLTVNEANELPRPNTSWMTDPKEREDFMGWTK